MYFPAKITNQQSKVKKFNINNFAGKNKTHKFAGELTMHTSYSASDKATYFISTYNINGITGCCIHSGSCFTALLTCANVMEQQSFLFLNIFYPTMHTSVEKCKGAKHRNAFTRVVHETNERATTAVIGAYEILSRNRLKKKFVTENGKSDIAKLRVAKKENPENCFEEKLRTAVVKMVAITECGEVNRSVFDCHADAVITDSDALMLFFPFQFHKIRDVFRRFRFFDGPHRSFDFFFKRPFLDFFGGIGIRAVKYDVHHSKAPIASSRETTGDFNPSSISDTRKAFSNFSVSINFAFLPISLNKPISKRSSDLFSVFTMIVFIFLFFSAKLNNPPSKVKKFNIKNLTVKNKTHKFAPELTMQASSSASDKATNFLSTYIINSIGCCIPSGSCFTALLTLANVREQQSFFIFKHFLSDKCKRQLKNARARNIETPLHVSFTKRTNKRQPPSSALMKSPLVTDSSIRLSPINPVNPFSNRLNNESWNAKKSI